MKTKKCRSKICKRSLQDETAKPLQGIPLISVNGKSVEGQGRELEIWNSVEHGCLPFVSSTNLRAKKKEVHCDFERKLIELRRVNDIYANVNPSTMDVVLATFLLIHRPSRCKI